MVSLGVVGEFVARMRRNRVHQGDHILHVNVLFHFFPGLTRQIMFEDRKQDQDSDTTGKTTVVQYETAMQGAGSGTHGGGEKAADDSGTVSVAPDKGTDSCREGNAVQVALRRNGPCQFTSIDVAEEHGENVKALISDQDRENIQRMLPHRGKCQSCQHDAERWSGKTSTFCEGNNQVQVYQKDGAINTDVHQADRHTVFLGKIAAEAGVAEQMRQSMKAVAIQTKTDEKANGKNRYVKQIGIEMVTMSKAVIDGILKGKRSWRRDTHGTIHKIINKKTKNSKGQPSVVQVVAFVPRACTWENCRNNEGEHDTKGSCKRQTLYSQVDRTGYELVFCRVAEQEFADKWSKGCRKHTYMKIAFEIQFVSFQIEKRSKETGQHVQKIQAVKAMGDNEEITGHCVGFGISLQSDHERAAEQAAGSGIEQSTGKTANGKIISDKWTGGDHDQIPVVQDGTPFPGITCCNDRGYQKGTGKSQCDTVDDLAVGIFFHNRFSPLKYSVFYYTKSDAESNKI